jgi:hypothetical protein
MRRRLARTCVCADGYEVEHLLGRTDPGAAHPEREVQVPNNKKPPFSGGFLEADEGTRTLDLLHGKQTLYQLSYIREVAPTLASADSGVLVSTSNLA